MNSNKKVIKRPYKAPSTKLASGFSLVIAGKEITNMGPAQKAAMVKSRLAAGRRRKVA